MTRAYFPALDGLRGLAAIIVVCFHAFHEGPLSLFPRGYLAVDFFYALSGFVIANAYLNRPRKTEHFLLQRVCRLYPSLLLAAALSAWVHGSQYSLAIYFAQAFVLFPALSEQVAYPANGPVWSMFSELIANIAFIAVLDDDTLRRCYGLCAIGAFGIVCGSILTHSTDFGPGTEHFWIGLSRVCFFFPLGIVMHQRFRDQDIGTRPLTLSAALLIATLSLPHLARRDLLVDLPCCLLAIPACLWLALPAAVSVRSAKICRGLGLLSYPLYLVHEPILSLVQKEAGHGLAGCSAALAASLLGGIATTWLFDVPVRIWLARQLGQHGRVPVHAR